MTVGELRAQLENFGDHLRVFTAGDPVVIVSDIDTETLDGELVVVIT